MKDPVDLVVATIAGARLTITGKVPTLPPHVGQPPKGRLLWTLPWTEGLLHPRQAGPATPRAPRDEHSISARDENEIRAQVEGKAPALIFESMSYDVYLEAPASEQWSVEADSPGVLAQGKTWAAADQSVTHLRLELDSEVGILGLTFSCAEPIAQRRRIMGRLEAEVFPRKVDYQSDYREIMFDVARISPALIFEASGRTAVASSITRVPHQTASEWYEILRALGQELLAALDLISRDPQKRLEPAPRLVPTERARRVTRDGFSKALRTPGNVVPLRGPGVAKYWPRRIEEVTYVPSFDSEGNRYVRWLIIRILDGLRRFEGQLQAPSSVWQQTVSGQANAGRWLAEIASFRPQLQSRLRLDWIASAGQRTTKVPSTRLFSHPLYARVFAVGQSLLGGLNVDGSPITDALHRPISSLYEYWCFIALLQALRRHGTLEQCTDIQIGNNGSRVWLKRGREGAATFRHTESGRKFQLYYNRTYTTPTVSQRPDASIHLETDEGIHVFDAKYRIQFDKQYCGTYGGVGPKVEDISTMHRYRDAIVRAQPSGEYERVVKSACVLFPWRDENAYRSHAFSKSLRGVGVGGLPFLPSSTLLVQEHLDRIIEATVAGSDRENVN